MLSPSYDEPTKRWHFWSELAKVGFFVKEYYLGTAYEACSNTRAGPGAKGQQVVYTNIGTILHMSSTARLYSQNPKGDLTQRLAVHFPPMTVPPAGFLNHMAATAAGSNPSQIAAQMVAQPLDF